MLPMRRMIKPFSFLYFTLWSDAINWTRSGIAYIGVWKLHTMTFISLFMSANILVILIMLGMPIDPNFLKVTIISSKISGALEFLTIYYLPVLIINYLLVFRKNQWKVIRKEYKHYNGKVYKLYFIGTFVIPFAMMFIVHFYQSYFD